MRRSETTASGWVLIKEVPGNVTLTMIPWRAGLTTIQVFGVYVETDTGAAVPVGDRPAYTFR